jgi:hypothetical protein
MLNITVERLLGGKYTPTHPLYRQAKRGKLEVSWDWQEFGDPNQKPHSN